MKRLAWVALLVLSVIFGAVLAIAQACDPPGGGINGPDPGSTVSGTIPIEVTVTRIETTVRGVDLYMDGNLVESINQAPYKQELDTTKFKDGEHTLFAKVRSLERPDSVLPSITFNIDNNSEGPKEQE